MKEEMPVRPRSLSTPYRPVAVYYDNSDSVEYVRKDVPLVYRRIDRALTLAFDMKDRSCLVGFRLKGFKNFYLKTAKPISDFVFLVSVLEDAFTDAGNEVFDKQEADAEDERRAAYQRAQELAEGVKLDLPVAVAS